MSGFAVCYGTIDRNELERMFKSISHRGPYIKGVWESEEILMAQNYLKADIISETEHFGDGYAVNTVGQLIII